MKNQDQDITPSFNFEKIKYSLELRCEAAYNAYMSAKIRHEHQHRDIKEQLQDQMNAANNLSIEVCNIVLDPKSYE